jgi:hypothetical protein
MMPAQECKHSTEAGVGTIRLGHGGYAGSMMPAPGTNRHQEVMRIMRCQSTLVIVWCTHVFDTSARFAFAVCCYNTSAVL